MFSYIHRSFDNHKFFNLDHFFLVRYKKEVLIECSTFILMIISMQSIMLLATFTLESIQMYFVYSQFDNTCPFTLNSPPSTTSVVFFPLQQPVSSVYEGSHLFVSIIGSCWQHTCCWVARVATGAIAPSCHFPGCSTVKCSPALHIYNKSHSCCLLPMWDPLNLKH